MYAAPYSPAAYAAAATWLDFVARAYARDDSRTVEDCDAAARAAIDRLERCGAIDGGAARLLLDVYDLLPADLT